MLLYVTHIIPLRSCYDALKGSSVIMYSNKKLRSYAYSVFPDWPGGIYGTPGLCALMSPLHYNPAQ